MVSAEPEFAKRLVDAVNRHDLDALVDCFDPGFVNETPLHPPQSFTGRDQVLRNWTRIFSVLPDLEATVLRRVVDGETIWMEGDMRGHRAVGSTHLTQGVNIFGIKDDRFAWVRFYLEPVEQNAPAGVDQAVAERLGR